MKRVHLRHWRAALVLVAVAGLVMSALGGGAFAASDSKSSGKADPSATLRVGAAMDSGGGVAFDPANLTANAANAVWMQLVYGSLIYDTADGGSKPGLATEWSAPDPTTVKLTLRDTNFSDGTPFTAAAAKAAWDRMLASPTTLKNANHKAITQIDAVDDHHIVIHLNAPLADTLINKALRDPYFFGVPSPTAAASGNLNQKPVGAGPYTLESRDGNQTLVFKKNSKYYDAKAAKLAGITFTNVASGVTQTNALMSNAVDLAWGLPQDSLDAVSANPDFKIEYFPGSINSLMQLCTSQGVFASKDARQAIQYAIDRKAINKAQYGGGATEVETALPPTHPYYEKALNSTYKYDPKKAKALLKKAGVAPGTKVSALVNVGPGFGAASEVIQANLKAVGLDMEITQTQNIISDSPRLKPDIGFLAAAPEFFSLFTLPGTPLNACSWTNQTVTDALATTSDGSKTPAEVKAAWHTFSTTMLDESAKVFFATPPYNVAMAKAAGGVTVYMDVHGPQLVDAFMTKSSS
jgi:peptide/nickel transport system substrate-binding protein